MHLNTLAASAHLLTGGPEAKRIPAGLALRVKIEAIYCKLMVFAKSSVLTTTPENAKKIGVGVLERVGNTPLRSEERRVGKECMAGLSPEQYIKSLHYR